MGTLEAGQYMLLGVLLLSSLLNIAYLLPVPVRAFFGRPHSGTETAGLREAPLTCLAAMVITSLACLILFFYPEPFYRLALDASGGH
jgi:multicomponent Na+:H+ antiporter subunit D